MTAKTMKKEENSDIHFVVRYSKKKYSKIFITLLVLLGSSLFLAYLWKKQAGSDFFFNVTVKVGLIYCIVELVKHLLYLFPKVKIVDVLISFLGIPSKVLQEILGLNSFIFNFICVFMVIIGVQVGFYKLVKIFLFEIPEKIIYFLSFFTILVLFSYANNALAFILRLFKNPLKNKLMLLQKIEAVMKTDFRKVAYGFAFIVYFLSVLSNLSDHTLIKWDLWNNYKSIALEGCMSFVTLDQCLTLIVPRIFKKNKVQ